MGLKVEVVPAVLRSTWEGIQQDWNKVIRAVDHVQIDVTDGVFAGSGSWRNVRQFKKLVESEKTELHMMVHNPEIYVADVIDLNPARCIFHIEAFADGGHVRTVYERLRQDTTTELALAINPGTPIQWLQDQLSLVHYVLFMGYNPGWSGQEINPIVFQKIGGWHTKNPDMTIAVDGHVDLRTIPQYVKAGAKILCANSSIFRVGDPVENIRQLRLVAASVV